MRKIICIGILISGLCCGLAEAQTDGQTRIAKEERTRYVEDSLLAARLGISIERLRDSVRLMATRTYVVENYVTNTDSRLSDSRTPTGTAGGDLTGTYPNPTIKSSVTLAGNPTVAGTLATTDSSNKVATTAFVKKMSGTTGPAGGDLTGTYPNPAIKPSVRLKGNPLVEEKLGFYVKDAYIEGYSVDLGALNFKYGLNISGTAGINLKTGDDGHGNNYYVTLSKTPFSSDSSNKVATTAYVKQLAGKAGGDLTGTYPNPAIKPSITLTGRPTVRDTLNFKGNGSYIQGESTLSSTGWDFINKLNIYGQNGINLNTKSGYYVTLSQTPPSSDNSNKVATTAYVKSNLSSYVPTNDSRLSDSRTPTGTAGGDLTGTYPNPSVKSSVNLTGSPTATTPATSTNSTRIATTAYVKNNLANYITTSDNRLTDSRTPTGTAGGDLTGTYPNPSVKSSVNLTGNPTVAGTLTVNGTGESLIKGNLRLKGAGAYGNKLNLGDGDYVYLYEETDDNLTIKAKNIILSPTASVTAPTPATTDNSTKVATTAYIHNTNIFDNPNIFYLIYDGGVIQKSSNIKEVTPYLNSAANMYYIQIIFTTAIDQTKLIPIVAPYGIGTDIQAARFTVKAIQSSRNPSDIMIINIENYNGTNRNYDSFSFLGFLIP